LLVRMAGYVTDSVSVCFIFITKGGSASSSVDSATS